MKIKNFSKLGEHVFKILRVSRDPQTIHEVSLRIARQTNKNIRCIKKAVSFILKTGVLIGCLQRSGAQGFRLIDKQYRVAREALPFSHHYINHSQFYRNCHLSGIDCDCYQFDSPAEGSYDNDDELYNDWCIKNNCQCHGGWQYEDADNLNKTANRQYLFDNDLYFELQDYSMPSGSSRISSEFPRDESEPQSNVCHVPENDANQSAEEQYFDLSTDYLSCNIRK